MSSARRRVFRSCHSAAPQSRPAHNSWATTTMPMICRVSERPACLLSRSQACIPDRAGFAEPRNRSHRAVPAKVGDVCLNHIRVMLTCNIRKMFKQLTLRHNHPRTKHQVLKDPVSIGDSSTLRASWDTLVLPCEHLGCRIGARVRSPTCDDESAHEHTQSVPQVKGFVM